MGNALKIQARRFPEIGNDVVEKQEKCMILVAQRKQFMELGAQPRFLTGTDPAKRPFHNDKLFTIANVLDRSSIPGVKVRSGPESRSVGNRDIRRSHDRTSRTRVRRPGNACLESKHWYQRKSENCVHGVLGGQAIRILARNRRYASQKRRYSACSGYPSDVQALFSPGAEK